jgi:hypothetical protein
MIRSEAQLVQAAEQLRRMNCALEALCLEVAPLNPRRFVLMAEGPLDEMQQLCSAIEADTDRAAATGPAQGGERLSQLG